VGDLPVRVAWDRGVVVECDGKRIALDPQRPPPGCREVFITHAHTDHSKALCYRWPTKYLTEETLDITRRCGRPVRGRVELLGVGESVRVGPFEVVAHDAGHILGSVEYEVRTPEGTILYTGDLGPSAEPVECDLLIIEATFGSPVFNFPNRRSVAMDMVVWALEEVLPTGKIPAFRADHVGNAQEVISIFNRYTTVPVVTHPLVSRVCEAYKAHGVRLRYVDASSSDGEALLESGKCVYVAPKFVRPSGLDRFEWAFVSGWASVLRCFGRPFPLSDHADFKKLMEFVSRSGPKIVLTFHGGGFERSFSRRVMEDLGVYGAPLRDLRSLVLRRDLRRVGVCEGEILNLVRMPGFVYSEEWIVKQLSSMGFSRPEVSEALSNLVSTGLVRRVGSGYTL